MTALQKQALWANGMNGLLALLAASFSILIGMSCGVFLWEDSLPKWQDWLSLAKENAWPMTIVQLSFIGTAWLSAWMSLGYSRLAPVSTFWVLGPFLVYLLAWPKMEYILPLLFLITWATIWHIIQFHEQLAAEQVLRKIRFGLAP